MTEKIINLLKSGAATSKQLQLATGYSQAVVSRKLSKLSDKIITLDRQRPPQYLLSGDAFGVGNKVPISLTNNDGELCSVGFLRPIKPKGFYYESNDKTPKVLLGGNKGMFTDLPYYLDDLRPQGFLGRQIAKKMSQQNDKFPTKLSYWNSNQIGRFIIANNDNLTGNIALGEQSLLRLQKKPNITRRSEYAIIADEIMQGEIFGSSAGGEQPKFTAFNYELQSHVIVKFSPKGKSAIAQRWRDVLLSEYHANKALNSISIEAAQTHVFEQKGRLFLESIRFDRVGMFGKLPMISLLAIDAEFVGSGESWLKTCEELVQLKLMQAQHLSTINLLSAFGSLINNTDMHLGNLSLTFDKGNFQPLPIYDMCSMGFAPRASELLPLEFRPKDIGGFDLTRQESAKIIKALNSFWQSLENDKRISSDFRKFCQKAMARP